MLATPRGVQEWHYTGADGQPYMLVRKYVPGLDGKRDKSFTQHAPNGLGGWKKGMDGLRPILYRLPEVLDPENSEIFIVEGEKDVDNLRKLGFTATTNPGGAMKWKNHYNEALKGKDIVIIPDNDKAGQNHAKMVAASLDDVAHSIKVITLPDLDEKGDVSDFIAMHPKDARELLIRLIDATEPYELLTDQKTINSFAKGFMDIGDVMAANIPEEKKLLNPWLKEQGLVLIVGEAGVGKSMANLGIANALTAGTAFGPWKCLQPSSVLYVDGEMTLADMKMRFQKMGFGKNRSCRFTLASNDNLLKKGLPVINLTDENCRQALKNDIINGGFKVVILDNLSCLYANVDENSKAAYDPLNQWLLEMRSAGVTMIVNHHTNKAGDQRGINSKLDAINVSIYLRKPDKYRVTDGARFVMRFQKTRLPFSDLPLLADTECQLIEDEHGAYVWMHQKAMIGGTKKQVLQLYENSVRNQADIAKELGISRQAVSKHLKDLKEAKYIAKNGELSPSGYDYLHDGEPFNF